MTVSRACATPPIQISARRNGIETPDTGIYDNHDITAAQVSGIGERLAEKGRQKQKLAELKKKPSLIALKSQIGFTPVVSDDEEIYPARSNHNSARQSSGASIPQLSKIVRKDFKPNSPGGSSMLQSRSSSPSPGISALSQQLENVNMANGRRPDVQSPHMMSRTGSRLVSETSNSSLRSSRCDDEDCMTDSAVYEVPLEHDFVSHEAEIDEGDSASIAGTPQFPDEKSSALRSTANSSHALEAAVSEPIHRKMQATDFEPLRCLGKGTFGTVLLVKQKVSGKLYAQKQFRKASLTVRKRLVDQTRAERTILENINRHAFVVKLYYAFQDHEKLYLILEYAQGGELFERMRHEHMFPEATAAFYMAEMVLALEHLHHTVGVVYRDLKPENCLLDANGHLLLTDFGLSKVAADGEECRSMTGTMEYMAPEVIQEHEYGTAVDWWSFGILGVDLLTGSTPFQAANDMKMREKIIKSKPMLPYYLSPDAKDLLTRLLRKEPKKRLGATMPKDMHIIKTHRFFRKIDWIKLAKRQVEPPIKPLITDPELAENFSTEFTALALGSICGVPCETDSSLPTDSLRAQSLRAVSSNPNISGEITRSTKSPSIFQDQHVDSQTVHPIPLHAHEIHTGPDDTAKGENQDPFGGFSFVGSRSLLEEGLGCF